MNHRSKVICLLAVAVLAAVLAAWPVLAESRSGLRYAPAGSTAAAGSTESAAAEPCPTGYAPYRDSEMAFSACYPSGWSVKKAADLGGGAPVTFTAPTEDGSSRESLRFISVSASPADSAQSDEQLLSTMNRWLEEQYIRELLNVPHLVAVGGHTAVEAGYEARAVFGREVVSVSRWVTSLVDREQQWLIEVAGRSAFRSELEVIRSLFLSHLRLGQ